MGRDAGRQKIVGVTVHGDFALVVGLGSLAVAECFGNDVQGWAAVLGLAIFVHEIGQQLALRSLGIAVPLVLGLHGARARTKSLVPWQTLLVAFAGPGANAVVALLLFGLGFVVGQPLESAGLVERFGIASVVMAAVEIVPLLPLDGGVALQAMVNGITGGRGEPLVQRSTIVAGGLVALAGVLVQSVALALLGAGCAALAVVALRRSRAADEERDEASGLAAAEQALAADDLPRARALVADVLARTDALQLRAEAAELGAWIELRAGDLAAAGVVLRSMAETLQASALLRATLLQLRGAEGGRAALDAAFIETPAVSRLVPVLTVFGHGDHAASIVTARPYEPEWMRAAAAQLFRGRAYLASAAVSQHTFERTQVPDHAYNAACALALAGRVDDAVAWLGKAVEAGFADARLAQTDPDLEPLRLHAGFASVLVSLAGRHPYRT